MLDFYLKKVDVLVCTTIIESGLDIPSANTIIIDRADTLGLAQLYQLRGRVGRDKYRAYAYLLVPADGGMSEVARKRLQVIAELTELGSGFQIAARDLEIRGAGNLLGAEQSGHIAAVGLRPVHPAHPGDGPRAEGRARRGRGRSDHPPPRRGIHSRIVRAGSRAAPEPVQAAGRAPRDAAADRFRRRAGGSLRPVPPEAEWLLQVVDLKIQARALRDPGDRRPPGSDPGALRPGAAGPPGDDRDPAPHGTGPAQVFAGGHAGVSDRRDHAGGAPGGGQKTLAKAHCGCYGPPLIHPRASAQGARPESGTHSNFSTRSVP